MKTLACLFLFFISNVVFGGSPIAEALLRNTIQAEMGIDTEWEHYQILRDYSADTDRETRNYSKELASKFSSKQRERLRQLYVQMLLHADLFDHVAKYAKFNETKKERIEKLLKVTQPKVEGKQREMLFYLRKEQMAVLFPDQAELDKVCGDRLHKGVGVLYPSGDEDMHAIGVDLLRCLNDGKTAVAMRITIGQRKKIAEFTKDRARDFLRSERKDYERKRRELQDKSGMPALRKMLSEEKKGDKYYTLSRDERNDIKRKLIRKLAGNDVSLTEHIANVEAEAFEFIDEQAVFIIEFIEETLTAEQYLELKQRVVQSAMVNGNVGLFIALRQVGYDYFDDRKADRKKFRLEVNDTDLTAMKDYVKASMYKDAIERVIGEKQWKKLVGKRHVFSGPFGQMPAMKSPLFSEPIKFLPAPENPRRKR